MAVVAVATMVLAVLAMLMALGFSRDKGQEDGGQSDELGSEHVVLAYQARRWASWHP